MTSLFTVSKSLVSVVFVLFKCLFYRAISSFVTGAILLFVAVLMFITFHQAYMPIVSHVKPVYIRFNPYCQHGDEEKGLCSYPEASVFFTPENKASDERMLMRGQSYKVFLDIEMPPSPTNERLGMFMVNLKLLSAKGAVLKSSSRSCMLYYQSNLVRLFRTLFYSLPLTLGLSEEKQKIEINFFEDYIDDSYNPAVEAKIVFMTRKIEIYKSTLRLQASFTGLRYLIFNYPILFACFAIMGNFITLTVIYSACVNQFSSNTQNTSATNPPQVATPSSLVQNGGPPSCSGVVTPALQGSNSRPILAPIVTNGRVPQVRQQVEALKEGSNRRKKTKNGKQSKKKSFGKLLQKYSDENRHEPNNDTDACCSTSLLDKHARAAGKTNVKFDNHDTKSAHGNGPAIGSRSEKVRDSKSEATSVLRQRRSSQNNTDASPCSNTSDSSGTYYIPNFPNVHKLGRYLRASLPGGLSKHSRQCQSNLELSSIAECRERQPKKSASTNDLDQIEKIQ